MYEASLLYFSARCFLPKDPGPCKKHVPSYYYDKTTSQCQFFSYGGCEGNQNRFKSVDECSDSCEGKNDSNNYSNILDQY